MPDFQSTCSSTDTKSSKCELQSNYFGTMFINHISKLADITRFHAIGSVTGMSDNLSCLQIANDQRMQDFIAALGEIKASIQNFFSAHQFLIFAIKFKIRTVSDRPIKRISKQFSPPTKGPLTKNMFQRAYLSLPFLHPFNELLHIRQPRFGLAQTLIDTAFKGCKTDCDKPVSSNQIIFVIVRHFPPQSQSSGNTTQKCSGRSRTKRKSQINRQGEKSVLQIYRNRTHNQAWDFGTPSLFNNIKNFEGGNVHLVRNPYQQFHVARAWSGKRKQRDDNQLKNADRPKLCRSHFTSSPCYEEVKLAQLSNGF